MFSFLNLLNGRSAVKYRDGLERIASCLVLPKTLPILALTFPHPGKLLSPRQKERQQVTLPWHLGYQVFDIYVVWVSDEC